MVRKRRTTREAVVDEVRIAPFLAITDVSTGPRTSYTGLEEEIRSSAEWDRYNHWCDLSERPCEDVMKQPKTDRDSRH